MTRPNKNSTGHPSTSCDTKWNFSSPMQLIKLVVSVSVLVAKVCFAGLIIDVSKPDESSLVKASVAILESCYAKRFTTAGLAGPSVGIIADEMSSRDTIISVTVIDNALKVEGRDPINRGSRYKLQVFAITVIDPIILVETLSQIRKTKWWNHMASFLLIDLPNVKTGCSNAHQILLEAWKMNLLNAKFMCLHQTKGRLIYTFNPYMNIAPVPWQQENVYKGLNDHPWTLFAREYRADESRCDKLDFDKTLDLGGHEIRASVEGMEWWWFEDPEVTATLFNQVQNVTAQILMDSLNANWTLLAQPWKYSDLNNSDPVETSEVTREVDSGISDICLNIIIQQNFENYEITYLLYESPVSILTKYPDHRTQLDKLMTVLDKVSRYGTLLVLIMTLLFFTFWLGGPFTSAILNIMLVVCNAAILRIPDTLAPRIYLCTLFIFVVTIQGIYSGQFASLLTKDQRLPTIDTIDDLARSDYKICGPEEYRIFLNDSAFEGRYDGLVSFDCTIRVLIYDKTAAIDMESALMGTAAGSNQHLSRESIGNVYGAYVIRPDWPLEERVNTIIERVAASGIVEAACSIQRISTINTIESYERKEQDPEPKVLTLKMLTFAFVILGIGLGLATITFIAEVIMFERKIENPCSRVRRYPDGRAVRM